MATNLEWQPQLSTVKCTQKWVAQHRSIWRT